jgi:hypothetical protein
LYPMSTGASRAARQSPRRGRASSQRSQVKRELRKWAQCATHRLEGNLGSKIPEGARESRHRASGTPSTRTRCTRSKSTKRGSKTRARSVWQALECSSSMARGSTRSPPTSTGMGGRCQGCGPMRGALGKQDGLPHPHLLPAPGGEGAAQGGPQAPPGIQFGSRNSTTRSVAGVQRWLVGHWVTPPWPRSHGGLGALDLDS